MNKPVFISQSLGLRRAFSGKILSSNLSPPILSTASWPICHYPSYQPPVSLCVTILPIRHHLSCPGASHSLCFKLSLSVTANLSATIPSYLPTHILATKPPVNSNYHSPSYPPPPTILIPTNHNYYHQLAISLNTKSPLPILATITHPS